MILREVEKPEGHGEVFLAEEPLGEVEYWLDVCQEIHKAPTGEAPGLLRISGRIRGSEALLWKIYEARKTTSTLRLADGRRWDFILKQGALGSDVASVVAASDLYHKD